MGDVSGDSIGYDEENEGLYTDSSSSNCTGSIMKGYYNKADGLFYEDELYTTPIDGRVNVIYIDLSENIQYYYNDNQYIPLSSSSSGTSIQPDWNQTDTSADDYIKNKPDLTDHLPIIATTKTSTSGKVKVNNIGIAVDVTFSGMTKFYGNRIWTDGNNIYYSSDYNQYVLDKSTSTWTAKTWNGMTSFGGNYIWTDGDNIYYSYDTAHKKLIIRRSIV